MKNYYTSSYTTKQELSSRHPKNLNWTMCSKFYSGECVFKELKKIGTLDNKYKVKTCPWRRTVRCDTLRIVSYYNQIQDGLV